ncbi:uncharacterized protein JCM6883_006588 [Sporobolomyces salmoneus]|uniref:uncharacterized protein n=1 Tax=Sporobolomyces salmoneus TaxID=183962 RepID=UPI003175064B
MPSPLSTEPYADCYPTITFSLLSPVLEETTPHLDQLLSPPPPLIHVEVFKEAKYTEEQEAENFAKIFAKFSFTSTTTKERENSPSKVMVSRLDLSPTMKEIATFAPTPAPAPPKPQPQARSLPPPPAREIVNEDPKEESGGDGITGWEGWYKTKGKACLKWVENCEKARKESIEAEQEQAEEQDLVGALEQSLPNRDPHPIYSRRRSGSVSQPTVQASTGYPSRASSPTSLPSSSRRSSLVIASHYTSPYSSLASTPETSPTSTNFAKSSSPANSKPSSIRSNSSRLSSLSNKLSARVKFPLSSTRQRSSSESKASSPFSTFDSAPQQAPPPPVPALPSLASLVPLSAPIPDFLLESELKEHVAGPKKKKRRDSMISMWKEEQKRKEINEALELAYGRIERERGGAGVRKSFDL